jgi:predicted PurR-regulated permease PerM
MDILRNLFGNLTSGIIRLAVTVGILAAAYFFLVKPILNSADNAINKTNSTLEQSFKSSGLEDVSKSIEDVNRQVQIQVERSFHTAKRNGNPKKLVHCIQHANGNVHRIQRCTVRF